jgi:hypothetical protein
MNADLNLPIVRIENEKAPEMISTIDRIDPDLASSLVKFQSKMRLIEKDGKAHVGAYTTYDRLIEAFREHGPECGLTPYIMIRGNFIQAHMIHENGSLSPASIVEMPEEHSLHKGNSMQGLGSDITYLKRYILSAMLNLASGDDTNGFENPIEGKSIGQVEVESKVKITKQDPKSMEANLIDGIVKTTRLPALLSWKMDNSEALKFLEKTNAEAHIRIFEHYKKQETKFKEKK